MATCCHSRKTLKNQFWKILMDSQRQGGDESCLPSNKTFINTVKTFYEDDILPFFLGISLESALKMTTHPSQRSTFLRTKQSRPSYCSVNCARKNDRLSQAS